MTIPDTDADDFDHLAGLDTLVDEYRAGALTRQEFVRAVLAIVDSYDALTREVAVLGIEADLGETFVGFWDED